jgi:hypothetical protein
VYGKYFWVIFENGYYMSYIKTISFTSFFILSFFTPRPLYPWRRSFRNPLIRWLVGHQSRSGSCGEEKICCAYLESNSDYCQLMAEQRNIVKVLLCPVLSDIRMNVALFVGSQTSLACPNKSSI